MLCLGPVAPGRWPEALGVTQAMNHEEAFVQAFIVPDKQSRYLSLLASRKRRVEFLDRLNHHLDYDPSFAVRVNRLGSILVVEANRWKTKTNVGQAARHSSGKLHGLVEIL